MCTCRGLGGWHRCKTRATVLLGAKSRQGTRDVACSSSLDCCDTEVLSFVIDLDSLLLLEEITVFSGGNSLCLEYAFPKVSNGTTNNDNEFEGGCDYAKFFGFSVSMIDEGLLLENNLSRDTPLIVILCRFCKLLVFAFIKLNEKLGEVGLLYKAVGCLCLS